MKRTRKIDKDDEGLTQADIDKAIERLSDFHQKLFSQNAIKGVPANNVRDDGKRLTIQLDPIPDSPITQFREGKPVTVKTVFHAVEVQFEDGYGGKFIAEYHILDTIRKIVEDLTHLYPYHSKADIEKLAKEMGKDFEEVKTTMADYMAHTIFEIRLSVAKFFHDQLETTLKTIVEDLIVDSEFFGLTKYGYELANAAEYERIQRAYPNLRKKRVQIIKKKGRPKGSTPVSESEFKRFLDSVFDNFEVLETNNHRITKHAVARKLYPHNSNALQQFNRILKRYDLDFDQIVLAYNAHKTNN